MELTGRRKKKKRATWGNPLQNSGCSLQLVELISRWPKKLNIKNTSVGEPLAKFRLLSSVAQPSMACLRGPRAAKNKNKRARWGDSLKNYGCSLQLVELIPCQPKKLNIKKSSVGEPLEKFLSLSSVASPSLDCLRRPRAANLIRFVW